MSDVDITLRELKARVRHLEDFQERTRRELHARVSAAIEKIEREFWRQTDVAREQVARLSGPSNKGNQ